MLENPDAFVAAVRETVLPLAGAEDRLGLSLPDICGRTAFVQLPNAPASPAEEREMLRWKLKEMLACDPGETRMAYCRSAGEAGAGFRYVVNLVRENAFAQLIEAFAQAGFQVDFAGFKTFNLWQQFRLTNPKPGKHLLLALDDEAINMLAADNDLIGACRTVAQTGRGDPVGEIARTLADWKRRKVIDEEAPFFLFSEKGDDGEWSERLTRSLAWRTRPLWDGEMSGWRVTPTPTRRHWLELSAALAAARLLAGG
jgi:hypothetical protein